MVMTVLRMMSDQATVCHDHFQDTSISFGGKVRPGPSEVRVRQWRWWFESSVCLMGGVDTICWDSGVAVALPVAESAPSARNRSPGQDDSAPSPLAKLSPWPTCSHLAAG